VDRRLATCTVYRRMRAAPFAAKLGEAFAEPQRILVGGRRGRCPDGVAISEKAHEGLDNDNRRKI
jgi:hypothetical protein